MKLNYTIKEVKIEQRELTNAERCIYFASKSTGSVSADTMSKIATQELKRIGLVCVCNPYLYMTGTFDVGTTRVATPSEIVAWNVLNISELCDSNIISCNKCPLDMDGECCHITTRARNAKQIMDGKEMIVEVVE